jgi:hypothetical protein
MNMRQVNFRVRSLVALLAAQPCGCGLDSATPPTDPPPAKAATRDHVQPIAKESARVPAPDPSQAVPEPSPSEPVKAVMACRPASHPDGATGELVVVARIARAHYLHAEADQGGTFTPLSIHAALPPGVEFVGDWSFPAPEHGRGGLPIYRDSVLLTRALKVTGPLPPSRVVTGVLRYQACNDELCWPPGKLELSASIPFQAEATR